MIRYVILLLVFLFSNVSMGQKPSKASKYQPFPTLKQKELAVVVNGSYKVFTVRKVAGLLVSENCIKENKVKCRAFQASKTKKAFPKPKYVESFNPAGDYCLSQGGRNLVATTGTGKQDEYCLFADNSLVNSWKLFYKHHPKPTKLFE